MRSTDKLACDAVTLLNQGRRERQEDAVASDFPEGSDVGFAVLGDGMGGHTSGEIASNIVVSEVFRRIKAYATDPDLLETRISDILHEATAHANASVGEYTLTKPETHGMGTTLLAPVVVQDRLYWISIGDSPLYIFRQDRLFRLNQIHTLRGQLEYLVDNNLVDPEDAMASDQNCLTSAIVGQEIAQIDCSDAPIALYEGDIVIAASDGLNYLADEEISDVLFQVQDASAAIIGKALMTQITHLDDPDQDNVACCVMKFSPAPRMPIESPVASVDAHCASPNTVVATLDRTTQEVEYEASMRKRS
ncbi:PP2C family protein-serine/threonine phosphatase [Marivita hallyeonensis]|nr:protein phosphatase 2C domain-containing protein [Marivita hallyeonensis]